ncbi:MAG: class I SAM-dependent methyltransferase [Leptolyngbyaceae cyanobacterium MO_188.B28]|nr:class I SAM-dependent methyltransferase [Leptolyngbyaceae cyanobacterium MO_188.B28]
MKKVTERFSDRVDNYIKYRPGYPPAIAPFLTDTCGLTPASTIVDVGSGTGILTQLFLDNGNAVFGVEPNTNMREAAEQLLAGYSGFKSIVGQAENTTLANHSVDFVIAGQAFHWFNPSQARAEFARILSPDGWVVLIWNERKIDSTPFLQAYEHLLKTYAKEYEVVNHMNVGEQAVREFYQPGTVQIESFDNFQTFDFEGVKGRLLSCSYAPNQDQSEYLPMMNTLNQIFEQYESNGKVIFEYDTKVYYGQLS